MTLKPRSQRKSFEGRALEKGQPSTEAATHLLLQWCWAALLALSAPHQSQPIAPVGLVGLQASATGSSLPTLTLPRAWLESSVAPSLPLGYSGSFPLIRWGRRGPTQGPCAG